MTHSGLAPTFDCAVQIECNANWNGAASGLRLGAPMPTPLRTFHTRTILIVAPEDILHAQEQPTIAYSWGTSVQKPLCAQRLQPV